MARAMGMQPKAPITPPQQIALQEAQLASLAAQQANLDRQEAEQMAGKAKAAATAQDDEAARTRRARGRVSLLNDEVGTVLAPTPGDLQRKLGG